MSTDSTTNCADERSSRREINACQLQPGVHKLRINDASICHAGSVKAKFLAGKTGALVLPFRNRRIGRRSCPIQSIGVDRKQQLLIQIQENLCSEFGEPLILREFL